MRRMSEADDTIKRVFGEAIRRPAGERRSFLDEACRGAARLRREVETLLRAFDEAGEVGFLNRPTGVTASTMRGTGAPVEGPGAVIGRYKLLQLIGEGGFGSVYMAEQTEPVLRRVALKIIKLGMDTKQVIARFEAERQALAMMDHPNIAKVLDAGATDQGRPYFVMELVKGEPITDYCDRHQVSVSARLDLFVQVCQAVQHAHQKGVIHRDLKPSNVLVTVADGRPIPKVIDFGIAKAVHTRLTEKTLFTEFRQLIGTPEYMSPEQAEMSGVDIDTRSDIYSLGVVLYELLTGTTPFDGRTLRSAAFGEMQRIIREVEPDRPSARLSRLTETAGSIAARRQAEPAGLRRLVRGDLDWIVMRCLDKDRTRRYETASNLAADVLRFLADEPVSATPPSRAYRLRKFVRRNRGAAVAASLVAGALVLGLIGTAAFALREAAARNRAEDAEENALARAAELEQVAAFQASQLEGIDPQAMGLQWRADVLAEAGRTAARAGAAEDEIARRVARIDEALGDVNLTNVALRSLDASIFARSLAAVRAQFAGQPLVRARLLQSLADAMRELGLLDAARSPQEEALQLRRRDLGPEHPDTLTSITNAAELTRLLGRLDEAELLFSEAFETSRRVLGDEHDTTLSAVINMGALRWQQGRLDDAEALAREAVAMCRRIRGEDHSDVGGTLSNLAFIIAEKNRFDEAIALMRESLDVRMRAVGEGHADTLESLNNLATLLNAAGDHAEALRLFEQVHEGRRRLLGDDHPNTITALSNIGAAMRVGGDLVGAEQKYREALAMRERVLGPNHPETIGSVINLGVVLNALGRREESEPYYRRGYEGRLRAGGPDDPETLTAMSNMGSLLDTLNRLDEAEPFVRGAYEGRLRVLGPDAADTLISQNNLAFLLQRQGNLDAAEPMYRDVLAKRRAVLDPLNPRLLSSVQNLAVLLYARGEIAEAESLLREAVAGRMAALGPAHPHTNDSRVSLAKVLLEQSRFEEAEAEAIAVEAALRDNPNVPRSRWTACVTLLIDLYDRWHAAAGAAGHDDKAAAWRETLAREGAG
jgi:serine/threonine protein kinase/tetratricopeptide (TPR) repeat protein